MVEFEVDSTVFAGFNPSALLLLPEELITLGTAVLHIALSAIVWAVDALSGGVVDMLLPDLTLLTVAWLVEPVPVEAFGTNGC